MSSRRCGGNMRAWKYVDADHADRVAEGSIKLGTCSSYAEIENGRADMLDSSILVQSGMLNLENPEHLEAAQRHGFVSSEANSSQFNNAFMQDIVLIHRSAPHYAFCMSTPGTPPFSPVKPQALFAVLGVKTMCQRLIEMNHSQLELYRAERVEYQNVEFSAMGPVAPPPNPFVKHLMFEPEREIRVVFKPRQPGVEIQPIFTDPDPHLACLLRRIY
jgi:hypothetical protein